jgi:DnaJ family protein C protein 9
MHLIEEAFGKGCDLYADVLQCEPTANKAQLRKAYYRAALVHHPDKNAGSASASHSLKFQAVSLAYQILQDADARTDYDDTGHIPSDAPDDEDDEKQGMQAWKQYFDLIFGKVTLSDIDAFSSKYKCSDEERRDVLKEFKARRGNLVKMLDFVMLSEPRDCLRWVEDYIRPSIEEGEMDDSYVSTMEKTLVQCQKKTEKEDAQAAAEELEEEEEADEDDEATESEEEEEEVKKPVRRSAATATATGSSKKKQPPPKKAKPTLTKRKKKDAAGGSNSMQDLIAQIQNKNRGGGVLASLGARYGVPMDDGSDNGDDNDPLNDAEFAKIQAKVNKRKQRK